MRNGQNFDQKTIEAVWVKASLVPGMNPSDYRKDSCGALIKRTEYGNTNSLYGWEIDHIFPVAKGGDDSFQNLQPLQWQNNRHKGDDYPQWVCLVR